MDVERKGEIVEKKLVEIKEEITSIKTDLNRLSELIGAGEICRTTIKKLEKVTQDLMKETAQNEMYDGLKIKVAKSNELKRHFATVNALASAQEKTLAIQKEIEILQDEIAKSESEITVGNRVYKKKEEEFIKKEKRVSALSVALDELIKDNEKQGKSDEYIVNSIKEYTEKEDGICEELEKKKKSLAEKIAKINGEIEEYSTQLAVARLNANVKRGIREGIGLEIALNEKTSRIEELTTELKLEENALKILTEKYKQNEEIIKECQYRYDALFTTSEKKHTVKTLTDEYNGIERAKQTLYRNQIISAILTQDITAVEKKIADNKKIINNRNKNEKALVDAKEKLIIYRDKCKKSLEKFEKILEDLQVEKRFYTKLDGMEYGEKCPICSAPMSKKEDCDKALNLINEKQKAIEGELQRGRLILEDYDRRIRDVDERLNEYNITKSTANAYLGSLKATMTSKMAELKRLYDECGVLSHSELTEKLEKVIKLSSDFGTAITDVKAYIVKEDFAKNENLELDKKISEIQQITLPKIREKIKFLQEEVKEFSAEYAKQKVHLGDNYATDLLEDIYQKEQQEDIAYENLSKLEKIKRELDSEFIQITEKISELKSRDYSYCYGENAVDFATLCVRLSALQYEEIVGEIRRAESEKQKSQDELVALNRLIKDKTAQKDELVKNLEEQLKRYEILREYSKTLKENESDFTAKFSETDEIELMKDILDETTEKHLVDSITAHEKALLKLTCEIETLTSIVDDTNSSYDVLETNLLAFNELSAILDAKEREYAEMRANLAVQRALQENSSQTAEEIGLTDETDVIITETEQQADETDVIITETER